MASPEQGRRRRQMQIKTVRRGMKKAIRKRVSADAFFRDGLLLWHFSALFISGGAFIFDLIKRILTTPSTAFQFVLSIKIQA